MDCGFGHFDEQARKTCIHQAGLPLPLESGEKHKALCALEVSDARDEGDADIEIPVDVVVVSRSQSIPMRQQSKGCGQQKADPQAEYEEGKRPLETPTDQLIRIVGGMDGADCLGHAGGRASDEGLERIAGARRWGCAFAEPGKDVLVSVPMAAAAAHRVSATRCCIRRTLAGRRRRACR